jgi:hypothetical protein
LTVFGLEEAAGIVEAGPVLVSAGHLVRSVLLPALNERQCHVAAPAAANREVRTGLRCPRQGWN